MERYANSNYDRRTYSNRYQNTYSGGYTRARSGRQIRTNKKNKLRKRLNLAWALIKVAFVIVLVMLAVKFVPRLARGVAGMIGIGEGGEASVDLNASDFQVGTWPAHTPMVANGEFCLDVPYISQEEYPTGCESCSAVMALNYAGHALSVDDFIDECLPLGLYPDFENAGEALPLGDDPMQAFIGDPRSVRGFGCYAPALKQGMENVGAVVADLSGKAVGELIAYIDNGTPVVVWATIDMREPYAGRSWQLDDGSMFTWTAQEHCLVLVGYDETGYLLNDPYMGRGTVHVDRDLFELRYDQMGRMALAVVE